ncbi:HAD-IIIC family phosphatase [Vibrio sp. Hep-1b-8]|uniref:HAD-IIIC family phosphatase n=1 Tax=Vibrio sp. Hep-1b-8 TaxID=2144187 RepID=UPI0011105E60|nr:HAD-IIIC family phosphatase [Vibrio sp. Hep-1b-8]TMX34360.1 hypothetical protein DA100_15740 [Vibrio sp. Hep-1b-8]
MIKFSSIDEQKQLFRKHRAIIRSHENSRFNYPQVRIALLSGVTLHPLKAIIESILLESGLSPVFFEGDYNAYYFESRFSKELVSFSPDLVYIHSTIDNLKFWPNISDDIEELSSKKEAYLKELEQCVDAIVSKTKASVVLNSLEHFSYRINGNIESTLPGGSVRFINEINVDLAKLAESNPRLVINDINYLSSKVGLENWRDDQSYFAFKQPYTQRAITEIARSFSAIVSTFKGYGKKALVLDLDNTLWGGIVGDDGVANLHVGLETPVGESYTLFQKLIMPLRDRGIAFAACSKNTESVALEGLQDPRMIISDKDFHVTKINWESKSDNIASIKKSLNIGMDSIVFIDDSDFERNEVKFRLPEVYIPDVANNALSYLNALSSEYVFETLSLSDEDMNRSDSFKSMIKLESNASNGNMDDYLKSLSMKAELSPLTDANITRVHQLINKTNQFNLTGIRLSLPEVEESSKQGYLITASLSDVNSNYGLVSTLWGDIDGNVFTLKNWVMSCRVFNRKFENYILDGVCKELQSMNVTQIKAQYIKSEKNKPVEFLLDNLGFLDAQSDSENKSYYLDINTLCQDNGVALSEIFK